MSVSYDVVDFGPEIEAAYARLFPAEKGAEMLRWRFRDNPHGKGYFAVARDGDRIIGMIALIATRLSVGGQIFDAVQAVDTIVAPEARGKFLFVRMAQAIYQQADKLDAVIIWGFPNAQAARGWFGRLGWKRFGFVPFRVRPLRTGYFLGRIARALKWIDFPLHGKRMNAAQGFRQIDRFGEESRELCDRFNAEAGCGLHYSPEFLNWRLIEAPHAAYRTVGDYGPDGRLRAMVAGIVLEKHGARIFYLMEAMGTRADANRLKRLLRHELAYATRQGAELALAWNSPTAPNGAALKAAGFLPLPERLRPVEIHVGAKPLVDEVPAAMMDGDQWYLSYLNSDTV